MAFEDDQDGSTDAPGEGTSWGLWAAAVVVVVVVLLGVWVVWPSGDAGDPDIDVGGPTSTAPSSNDEQPAGEGECPELPEGDEIPETGPEVDWEIVYGAALPFSEDHGPAVVEGDIARCFSNTPTGALIAAAQIDSRAILARDGVEVVRDQTVPGPGQDRLVEVLEERGWGPALPGQLCQTAGFRIVTYSAEEAVFAVASRCPETATLQLTEATLRWVDGDWRSVLQDDGSFSATSSVLSDLSGMTPWGGV